MTEIKWFVSRRWRDADKRLHIEYIDRAGKNIKPEKVVPRRCWETKKAAMRYIDIIDDIVEVPRTGKRCRFGKSDNYCIYSLVEVHFRREERNKGNKRIDKAVSARRYDTNTGLGGE